MMETLDATAVLKQLIITRENEVKYIRYVLSCV